ncbi:hypothetical protein NKH93_14395 [Mesorhizobium sp. M0954]
MFKYLSREGLTREQSEALEKAAFLIISARREAAALLARAGVTLLMMGLGSGTLATRI